MPKLKRRVITVFISTQNLTALVRTFLFVAFFSVSLFFPLDWMQVKTIVLFRLWQLSLFPQASTWSWLKLQESPFGTLSMCLPLKTLSHFPVDIGFVFFLTLGDCTLFPQNRSGLWNFDLSSSDQYEVSLQYSIVDSSVSHCFDQVPDHAMPSQSEVERNSVILTCTILPGHDTEGISLTDNRAWSCRASKSWTSSFCKLIVTKSASPCTASEAPVARKYS